MQDKYVNNANNTSRVDVKASTVSDTLGNVKYMNSTHYSQYNNDMFN